VSHNSFLLDTSAADAMIAAYTLQHNAVLMHKDPEFSPLTGMMLQENLPFK
jgi:predicted nucleic acid-binding protein